MPHFDTQQLADHVRGVLEGPASVQVDRHLQTGCSACERKVRWLRRVVVAAESEMEPPDYAVRSVIAYYRLRGAWEALPRRRLATEIVFDTLLQPAAAGTRNLQQTSRHLVFNSENYIVDARMEYGTSGRGISVVGQILTRSGEPVAAVPAFLITGDQILTRDSTSGLGEFCMHCAPRGSLRLVLSVTEHETIELDLDRRRPGGGRRGSELLLDRDFRGASGPAESRDSGDRAGLRAEGGRAGERR